MRTITAALLLSSCLAVSGLVQAQTQQPAGEPRNDSTQSASVYAQPQPDSDPAGSQTTCNQTSNKDQNAGNKEQAAQCNCGSAADPHGGDPDAPQNHVEYGGGG